MERLESWIAPPRLPLGDPYRGQCRANPLQILQPDGALLQDFCNQGYARGQCPHFPSQGNAPDAARFSVARDRDNLVKIGWALEKDHHHFQHGTLEYCREKNVFTVSYEDELIQSQAQAYLNSYLRRKYCH